MELTKEQIKKASQLFYANSAGCNPSIKIIEELAAILAPAAFLTEEIIEIAAAAAYERFRQINPIARKSHLCWEEQIIAVRNDWKDAIEAAFKAARGISAAPGHGDMVLIAKMSKAFHAIYGNINPHVAEEAMAAALAVAHANPPAGWHTMEQIRDGMYALDFESKVIVTLLARLAPKPLTPEERVTLELYDEIADKWRVVVDDNKRDSLIFVRKVAEIYRIGLIETLKKEAGK